MLKQLLWITIMLLTALSCGQDPGSFTMSFSWNKLPEGKVWIWVRVEERTSATQSGPILASAGPEAYEFGDSVALEMNDVANGPNRYIIAEVREGASSNLPIIYYGISDPFELAPGIHNHIEVPMELKIPEAQAVKASISLEFNGKSMDQVGLNEIHSATIITRSVHADSILLANDAGFSANQTQTDLITGDRMECGTEEEDDVSWDVCTYKLWDLAPGTLDQDLSDQEYTVFAKFVDLYGYESQVYRASVVLDSQGPQVLLGSLTPDVAYPGADVYLSVSFHETAVQESLLLTVVPDLPLDSTVGHPERVGSSNTYVWELNLAPTWPEDKETFTFLVSTEDMLGNKWPEQEIVDPDKNALSLLIDPLPPVLVEGVGETFSQGLFGLPDAGKNLTFSFAISEANPHVLTIGADNVCQGICPVVKIGNAVLGSVKREVSLDVLAENQLGFSFEYYVDDADFIKKDSEPPVSVTWTDRAGNGLEAVISSDLHFDFQPPEVLSCALVPEFGNATSVFTYTVTASESLPEAPLLNVESDSDGLFDETPEMSDNGQTWEWQQPASGLASQDITVSAQLTDHAGNTSASFLCPRTSAVDGEPPLLVLGAGLKPTLWTIPEVLNAQGQATLACGDGYELRVMFTVTEAKGIAEGYPDVRLAVPGKEIAFLQHSADETGDNQWTYEYAVVLTTGEHADSEGSWPVRVTLQDNSANETVIDKLADAFVKLDFTPPDAECSLIPANTEVGYQIGQKVMLQITALEELSAEFVPSLAESFEPPFEPPLANEFFMLEEGTKYRFARTILDTDGERSFEVGVFLTDIVGNSTAMGMTACNSNTLVTGNLDGAAPTVESVAVVVDGGEVDVAVTPLKEGREVAVTVTTAGSLLPPVLSLGKGTIPQTVPEPVIVQEGLLEWSFARTLDGIEGEGIQYIRATIQDEAGNETTHIANDKPLTLDFTPPVAQCKFFPPAAKVGDTVTVSINTSEPLLGGLPAFTSVVEGFEFIPPDSDESTTSFEYTHFISEADAMLTAWSFEVSLTDLAGNSTDDAVCFGTGSIDAEPPVVDSGLVSVWTEPEVLDQDGGLVLAVGPGDTLLVSFTIAEAQSVPADGFAVMVDIPGAPVYLGNSGLEAAGEGLWSASFELIFEPDDFDDPAGIEGLWPLKTQVEDEAGNVTLVEGLGGELVRIDFSPPEAECSLIPIPGDEPYGIGQKILVQAAALESLSPDDMFAPLLDQQWNPEFADLEDDFFVTEQKLRFAGIVKEGDGERIFKTGFRLTDLVGNQTPQGQTACIAGLLEATIDGQRPVVHEVIVAVEDGEVDHTTTPLKAGLVVTALVTIENSAIEPSITLGSGSMETFWEAPLDLGNDLHQWQFQRTLDGSEGESLQVIVISGFDSAGNSYSHSVETVPLNLDFTGPTAKCIVLPDLAKLGDKVVLQVKFSEPLVGSGIPIADSDVELTAPVVIQTPGTAEFTWTVGPQHSGLTSWTYSITLTDMAGNDSDGAACQGSGLVDAILPELSDETVATVPVVQNKAGSTVLVVGDMGTVSVNFKVAEAQAIHEDYPQVFLNVPGNPLPFTMTDSNSNQDGTVDYHFEFTVSALNHKDAEGKWPIRVVVEDDAGNHIEEPKFASDTRVQLDFSPPGAECSLIPDSPDSGYPIGQKLLLQVFPYEELQLGSIPQILETVGPDPGNALFQYNQDSSYSYTHIVDAEHGNLDFTLRVTLTDLVGNSTSMQGNACAGGELAGSTDAIPPAVLNPVLKTIPEVTNYNDEVVLMAGPDDKITASFDITEHESLDVDEISVSLNVAGGAVSFDTVSVEQVDPHLFHVESTLTLDQIIHATAEGAWPVNVTLADNAGNVSLVPALTGKLVTIDFTVPTAACSLIPVSSGGNRLAIGQNVMLQVNPVEEIQDSPVLQEIFIPSYNDQFFVAEQDTSWRWNHVVQEQEGEHSFFVMVSMTDLVGNTTEQNQSACGDQVLNGFFDGIRPHVDNVEVALDPPGDDPLTTPLKFGRTIVAAIDTSNQSMQPDAQLGTGTMSPFGDPVDLGNGATRWTFQRTLDGSEGHGSQLISVSGQDTAGNSFAYDELAQPLILDFTTPAAQCSMFPTSARLNDTVVFTVNVSEELAGNTISFTGNLPFGNPQASPDGLAFTYEYQVANPAIGITGWTYSIQVCDEAGNCGTGAATCSGTVNVDAEVPAVTNPITVSTNPVIIDADDNTVKAVRHGGVITASFVVSELSALEDDSPGVKLNAGGTWVAMTKDVLNHNPDAGTYEASYTLTVDENAHAALQGLWPIRVELEDTFGNIGITDNLGGADNRVRLDFTPPEAECALIPSPGDDPYGIEQQIVLQVSPLEAVSTSQAPILSESFNPDPDGLFFALQQGTTYRWQGTVGEWLSEGTFGAEVRVTDLVGNTTPLNQDVCSGEIAGITYDALRPTVGTVTVSPQSVLRAGQKVTATFTVTNTGNTPDVTVGTGAMSAANGYPQDQGDNQYLWQFERTLTGDEGHSQQQVTVSGEDASGNTYTYTEEANLATFDFVDPIADCFINANPAKSGDTLRMTVSLSEPISEDHPDETTSIDGFWTYSDALSSPNADKPYFVFEHSVQNGDSPVTWETTVQAHDIAGNPVPTVDLCSLTGAIDASGIIISEDDITIKYGGQDTGVYARYGSALTITFDVDDTPAQSPVVRVGGVGASKSSGPVDGTYVYSFQVSADQGFESGQNAAVTAWVVDAAGNETFDTLGTVTMDFDDPALATTPYFVRCDNLDTARIDTDEIWVYNSFDCTYTSSCVNPALTGPVQVSFALSELIDTDTLDITVDDLPLTIDTCNTTESFVTALYTPSGGESQQSCRSVSAQTTDLAGNTVALELGCFWFDFSRPSQPAVNTSNQIVYTRIPWGTTASGGTKLFTLEAPEIEGNDVPAVEAEATVQVWDAEETEDAGLIGTTTADADGLFDEFELNPIDRAHVFLTIQDAAGNQSDSDNGVSGIQATLVRDVVWYATLGDKVAGSFLNNPHTFETTSWFRGTPSDEEAILVQNDASEYGEAAGIATDDSELITTKGALITWRKMGPNEGFPPQRAFQGMAVDKARGRVVLFGGYSGTNTAMSDTWEWDGDLWHYISPEDPEGDGNPEARWGHTMAFQEHRGTVVMFSGHAGSSNYFSDTWEWNGVSWKKLSPANSPSVRRYAAMAYDSERAETVLFGGRTSSYKNDTWTFDGENWSQESPATLPAAYPGNPMVFDNKRNVIVMYGGNNGHVYEWNGLNWTDKSPSGPGQRGYSMMAYDPGLERTILVGGDGPASDDCNGYLNDIWYWNGTSWSKQNWQALSGESSLSVRRAATMVYDPMRGSVWVYGGQRCAYNTTSLKWEIGVNSFTMEWRPNWFGDGTNIWKLIGADVHDGNPPSRQFGNMVYSGETRRAIMFGGTTFSGAKDDTWRWYSPQWEDYTNETYIPSARFGHGMALANRDNYHGVHDIIIMFGGGNGSNQLSDTWGAWAMPAGETIGWVEAKVNQAWPLRLHYDSWCPIFGTCYKLPSKRAGHALVYDSKKDHFLMFGGYYTSGSTYYPRGDTWRMEEKTPNIYEWGWVEMSSVNAPEARFFHAMTYDDVEDRVILFGGAKGDIESYSNTLGDTYQHDGTNWSKKSIVDYHDDDQAGGGPSPRWGSVMAYDSDRGMSIMFGGRGEVSLNESWEYMEDKYSWRYLPAADAEGDGNPVERFNASMIYDDYNHELVMMGGSTDTFSGLADTWVGRYDISKRPAHLAHFRFAAAGYCEMPDVNKVNIDWVTGANGFSSTNGTKNGAYLRMWSKGEWLSPTNVYNGSLYPSPSNLSWSTSDAATIKQMLIGDEKTAHFVVFPRGINHNTKQNQVPPSNNDGLARITTDYVQYKVTYRLGADDHSQCE